MRRLCPKAGKLRWGRVRGLAPHRGYAAITRYVQLPPVHGRTRATRMHGILIKADWMPPETFDTHFTDKPHKISRVSEPQKEAAQKAERSAPILMKTKHRVVDAFAELLKNWGTALICEILR